MESNGVEGKIVVSEVTKNLLEEDPDLTLRFDRHIDVECKASEKPIPSYLITKEELKEEVKSIIENLDNILDQINE